MTDGPCAAALESALKSGAIPAEIVRGRGAKPAPDRPRPDVNRPAEQARRAGAAVPFVARPDLVEGRKTRPALEKAAGRAHLQDFAAWLPRRFIP